MYLKKLELKGFKSFPNRTTVLFDQGITAIVGPNGSGKSNISDAIRWVLGEQSIKSLRGEKMEDVIFSGTDRRPGMNYCEVSITLDNDKNKLNIDSNSVEIKRRSYRSGESEFYLNGRSCRLKDIRELLLDTGIGKDGYSIIEQGKVDEILNGTKDNRRKIFDEACGIAKYRYKKNEAEKNLIKTSENLTRLEDIFVEIEGQIRPLERQKDKAEKYLSLEKELKALEINDAIRKNREYDKNIEDLNNRFSEVESESKSLQLEKDDLEVEKNKLENKISDIEAEIDSKNEVLQSIKEEIYLSNSELSISKDRIKSRLSDIEKNKIEIGILEEKISHIDDDIEELNKNMSDLEKDLSSRKDEYSSVEKNKDELLKNLKDISDVIDDNKKSAFKILERRQEISKRLAVLNESIKNSELKISEYSAELSSISDENIKIIESRDKDVLKKEDLEKRKKTLEEELDGNRLKLDEVISRLSDISKISQTISNDINAMTAKKNTYIEMEKHHEGFNLGVKSILKKSAEGVHGAFGSLIKTDETYEKAIEASLGAQIQNIVVDNESIAKNLISYLKKNNLGRVTFLPLSVVRGSAISIPKTKVKPIGVASNLVSFDEKFRGVIESLLGRIVVLENIDDAISFARETSHRYKLVTLDGDILNPGGSMTGGSQKYNSNILSRRRLIDELEVIVENRKVELSKIYSSQSNLEDDKKKLEDNHSEISSELKVVSDELIKIIAEIGFYDQKLDSSSDRKSKIEDMMRESTEDVQNVKEEVTILESESSKISDENKENDSYITSLLDKQNQIRDEIQIVSDDIHNRNIEIMRIEQSITGISGQISYRNKEKEESMNQIRVKNKHTDSLNYGLNSLDERVETLENKIKGDKERTEEILSNISEIKDKRDSIREDLEDRERDIRKIDRSYMDIKEERFKIESRLERAKSIKENLYLNIKDRYSIDLDIPCEYEDDSLVIDKGRIESLKLEIKNLGNINLDSIEEYKEAKGRYDFYKEQIDDLTNSIDTLNKLISEIKSDMEREFVTNFEVINKNFVKVYKTLFGGGNANLNLSDETKILECDIEITAQPPGKKMRSLSLLSGGEKALTAISILFGILISKPTPFCILDEIEAPLDDVNVDRFGEFLEELSGDTQFIAVTHRRGTMGVADNLYGITMQEKGVSTVLNIRLNEAEAMAEAN